jgi:hypothetical protein
MIILLVQSSAKSVETIEIFPATPREELVPASEVPNT